MNQYLEKVIHKESIENGRVNIVFDEQKKEVKRYVLEKIGGMSGEKIQSWESKYLLLCSEINKHGGLNEMFEYGVNSNNLRETERIQHLIAFLNNDVSKKLFRIMQYIDDLEVIEKIGRPTDGHYETHGGYLASTNSIVIYRNDGEEYDEDILEVTMYHEIQHSISSLVFDDNQSLSKSLQLWYKNNLLKVVEKDAEIDASLIRMYKEQKGNIDFLIKSIDSKIPKKNKNKDIYVLSDIDGSYMSLIIEEYIERYFSSFTESQQIENIKRLLDGDNGMINSFQDHLIDYNISNFDALGGKGFEQFTLSIISNELYPILKKKLVDLRLDILENLTGIVKDSGYDEYETYITDKGEYNDEFRVRIITLRHFLNKRYCLIYENGNNIVVKRDDKRAEGKEKRSLSLSTVSDRDAFINEYDGLYIINNGFDSINKRCIEVLFNDRNEYKKAVEVWNYMVANESTANYTSSV